VKAGDWVYTTDPVMGFAQGPSAGHGHGSPREIPAGALCEVYAIEPVRDWVTIHYDLEDSGPREPFRIQATVELAELRPGLRPSLPPIIPEGSEFPP
jgi:hypothetical protein